MSDCDSENCDGPQGFHHQRRRAVVKRKKANVREEDEEEIKPQLPGIESTRLSEQFNKEASKSEELKFAYEECWKFEGNKIGNSEFFDKIVKGTLKKRVDGFKLE